MKRNVQMEKGEVRCDGLAVCLNRDMVSGMNLITKSGGRTGLTMVKAFVLPQEES